MTTTSLLEKYAAPVPRYTSYPTAPNFTANVDQATYANWLSQLPVDATLSLYTHIPFCKTLCWYCGCTTKMTKRYDPVATYLEALLAEVRSVARHLSGHHPVQHVHWGGGSPNILKPSDILRLSETLRQSFSWDRNAEFAVEIDPRYMTEDQTDAFARAGVNRISLGVQDFDDAVQAAINRHQSFEDTANAVDQFRSVGVRSINIDLVYGFPHQTCESVARTIDQTLSLDPDRIAVFGYAHLPTRLKHQRMIDDETLPGVIERFDQSQIIAEHIVAAGYRAIGLDHFAKSSDTLASAPVQRNFQGYTGDSADALIGLGASSIGKLPQGYVQNAVASGDYIQRVSRGDLAVVRGVALTDEDRARAFAINQLMCELTFSAAALRGECNEAAEPVVRDAEVLLASSRDNLLERTKDGFRITEQGRPFVRTICSHFDRYLKRGAAQHALGV